MIEFEIERKNERDGVPPTCAWLSIDIETMTIIVFIGGLDVMVDFGAASFARVGVPIAIHNVADVGVYILGIANKGHDGKMIVDRISGGGEDGVDAYVERMCSEIINETVTPAPLGMEDRTALAKHLADVWKQELRLALGGMENN